MTTSSMEPDPRGALADSHPQGNPHQPGNRQQPGAPHQPSDPHQPADPVSRVSREVVRLTKASHAMRMLMVARRPDGVEWSTYVLLFHLVGSGPQRSSALAEASHVDPSTVSRQVAQLVKLGLAERRADPADGRASLLVATDKGRAVHDEMWRRRREAFGRMLADWPPDDVEKFADLLAQFNDRYVACKAQLLADLTDGEPDSET